MGISGNELNAMAFRLFSDKEIREMSVMEVVTPNSFDSFDHPFKGGLYDLTMGPGGTRMEACLTCKQMARQCPGHFGYIEFPVPILNPIFNKEVFYLLKSSCQSCYKLAAPQRYKSLFMYQLKLLNAGYVTEAQELATFISDEATPTQPGEEATDILMEDKISLYLNERKLDLGREIPPTKTAESLRLQFVDSYLKRAAQQKACSYCKGKLYRVVYYQDQLIVPDSISKGDNGNKKTSPSVILPGRSKMMLHKIWEANSDIIETLFPILKNRGEEITHATDMFYMNVMLVTPPKTRPLNIVRGLMTEHHQTRLYKEIIKNCIIVRSVIKAVQDNNFDGLSEECRLYIQTVKGDNLPQKLQSCWSELQRSVDSMLGTHGRMRDANVIGLKQLIEKKEGALRKFVMGKRVNYAARSVITPDPNLLIHEIGIPEHFAKKLTYPVKVNFFNVRELRQMVVNGPDVYPGATMVEAENGSMIRLFGGDSNKSKREGVAKLLLKSVESGGGRTVHRHLLNGDVLLLNRQPTLHRPSIMAHTARILKGEKTLRMHYSNCKSYNADFDGDEMNVHLPQSEIARSEAYNIVGVKNNYLVPKDGTPLGGLIQDHVISGVRLTMRGQFFNREDYYHLVYQGLSHHRGEIKLLPPAILKPRKLWSGKQIISTILINIIPKNKSLISLHAKAKIRPESWRVQPKRQWKCGIEFKNPSEMSESEVIIHNGQLLCGVLDKEHYGATPYGLTHCLYDLYGGSCSSSFLDSAGKLFTAYLQFNGFTLGIKDIIINEKQDKERDRIIENVRKIGDDAARAALELDDIPPDLEARLEKAYYADRIKFKAKLDQEYKKLLDNYTNEINKTCLPRGLITRFPQNNLQLMVASGAKGSTVNTMQISCLLGQIELEGKRPPWMISGKSLPCYKPFETKPSAGGYIDARFMTGITPQDFFFHCMAGREGLIDTAVKTSRSGYLQRCLIKLLEGVIVAYDGTVRDHDGSVIQYAYGEDGLEVQKSTFLKKERLDFLYRNKNSIVDKSTLQVLKDSTNLKKIEKHKKRIKAWDDDCGGEKWRKSCRNGFALFSAHIQDEIAPKYWRKFNEATGRCKATRKILKKWNELDKDQKDTYKSLRPDPLISKFNRNADFGVITESLESLIEEYLGTKARNTKLETTFRNIVNLKYMSSLCEPGEAVGLLAAQSIGEPSTQMTLNTFHFAGRGEMNVTLGIPRLREILMTATKEIKTPYMDVPLKPASNPVKLEKRGNKLKKAFQRVTLADVLQNIDVKEKLVTSPSMLFTYTIRFTFLPHKSYKKEFQTTPKDILRYMEKDFLIGLCKQIRKLGKKYGDIIYESKEEKELTRDDERKEEEEVDRKSVDLEERKLRSDSVSSVSDIEMDDDDATATKRRQRHDDDQEYDEESDGEEEEELDKTVKGDEADEETVPTMDELLHVADRENFVLTTFPMVKSYKFDVAKEEWCEMLFAIPVSLTHIDFSSILKDLCESAIIYSVPNVKRAILYQNTTSGQLHLKTEGINVTELSRYNKLVDLNKIYTNDIHEMARVYGIEAAARVIVNELKEVFGVYGITVNPRHLLLIADYMTHQGVFSPFNRTGMGTSASPFQQMSFESSITFLKSALINGKTDALDSPSSRIMTGRYCMSGTGSFDVINESVCMNVKKSPNKECSRNGYS